MSVPMALSQRACSLPVEERASLARDMIFSLCPDQFEPDPEWEAAWAVEIERRSAALERGEAILIPAEEVIARMRESIRSARKQERALPPEDLCKACLSLDVPERADLFHALLTSMSPREFDTDLDDWWIAEISARLDAVARREARTPRWREVLDRFQESIDRGF